MIPQTRGRIKPIMASKTTHMLACKQLLALSLQLDRNFSTAVLLMISLGQVHAINQLLGTISVDSQLVSDTTTFNFDLISTEETVASNDYLLITLPTDLDSTFSQGQTLQCSVDSATVASCLALSNKEVRITFGARMTTNRIVGSVYPFVNPKSNQAQSNIQIALFNAFDEQRTVTYVGSLASFETRSLSVSLSSSSDVVGDQSAILQIDLKPESVIAAVGFINVNFPSYYDGAGSDQMIATTSPLCSSDGIDIQSCSFVSSQRILSIEYETLTGEDEKDAKTIFVRSFKNPVKPQTKDGFTVTTTDSLGFAIGESGDTSLRGVTEPADFGYVAFSFDDTAEVGQYASFRIELGMDSSLGPQCFVKVDFPDDFTTDFQLINVFGTSFLRPRSGSTVTLYESDLSKGTFAFEACQNTYGSNPTGSLVFQRVQNPQYIRETGTFKIYIAADADFTEMIALKTIDLTIAADQLQGGTIRDISITPADTLVNAVTAYTFQFTPASSIDARTQAKVEIVLPESLSFSSDTCSIDNRSSSFSFSMSCNLDEQTITLSYIFSNKPDFAGGTPLSVTLSEIINASYVGDVGAFTISTYIQVDNVFYLQDQSVASDQVTTTSGLVSKGADIYASSYRASQERIIYIFDVSMQNEVPINGRVRFTLPADSGMDMNVAMLQNNCFRLDYSQVPINVDCFVNLDGLFFDVVVRSSTFGTDGLPADEQLKIQVAGFKNPRTVDQQVVIKVESFDQSERLIDESTDAESFIVTMKTIGELESVSIMPLSTVNGAQTVYRIDVLPNLQVKSGDNFFITFPKEILLPSSYYMECSGSDSVAVNACLKTSSSEVKITFGDVSEDFDYRDTFYLWVYNIVNPVSFKPTSSFGGIKIVSLYGYDVAQYLDSSLTLTTDTKADFSYTDLHQVSLAAGQQTMYIITLQPDTRLPSTTAFRIETPPEIDIVDGDVNNCYVDSNKIVRNKCSYRGDHILEIRRSMSHLGSSDYFGSIVIAFEAINPESNFYEGVNIVVEISLDDSFKYPIASVEAGLATTFECNYPCISCSPNDPDNCESCAEGPREREFLQADKVTGKKTCTEQCDLGYTWDKAVAKACFPCDPSCETCRQGGEYDDARMCNTCAMGYNYLWIDEARCFSDALGCPQGTFEYTKERCRACVQNCQICSSETNCLRCDAFSETPLLQNEGCVSECQPGKTPVYTNDFGQCVNCEFPCATCSDGNPEYCLTCAAGDFQFLFGGQCLPECPAGTTRDLLTSKCIGCRQGCIECDLEDNSICIRCDTGLSLYKKQCLTECPVDYKKSLDGTVCEPRTYPFDRSFVPFPFVIMLTSLFVITLFCWILTKRKTLILQMFILQTALVLQLALIFELLRALAEGQALFITFTILVLIANTLLSLAFSVTFHIQIDDYQFNMWREENKKAYRVHRFFFTFFSMHLFRLTYSKMFMLDAFKASATIPHDFVRPLRLYSKLHMFLILLPILTLNAFGMMVTFEGWWDNQLQMTMFETVCMAPLLAAMLLIEMYRTDPRALLHKPTDENPFFVKLFVDESDEEEDQKKKAKKLAKLTARKNLSDQGTRGKQLSQGASYWDLAETKIRHTKLHNIIRLVKSLADINLNNGLDQLIEVEIHGRGGDPNDLWEVDSCPDLYHGQDKVKGDLSDEAHNRSFPGLNQDDVDPKEKCMELMEFFNEMAELDAQRERDYQEKLTKKKMKVDSACMHDTELIDNCFFTSKQKVAAQAQTIALEVLEKAISAQTPQMDISKYTDFGPSILGSQDVPEQYYAQSQRDKEATSRGLIAAEADQLVTERQRKRRTRKAQAEDEEEDEFPEPDLLSGEKALEALEKQHSSDFIYQNIPVNDSKKDSGKRNLPDLKIENSGREQFNSDWQEPSQKTLHENLRKTPKRGHRNKKSRKLVPNDSEMRSEEGETLHGRSEAGGQDSDIDGDEDDDQDSRVSVDQSATISTTKRTRRKGKLQKERSDLEDEQNRRKKLASFMNEPLMPANSRKWLERQRKMQTIFIDEEIKAEMKEPHEGMQLQEEVGQSEPSTEKTVSQRESLHLSEKDRIGGGISEESYLEDDALFYRNNYPYDTHESISSVNTNEHAAIEKVETRKDFTQWMRESVVVNQRTFNENEVLGNFARDEKGRILNRNEVVLRRNYRDLDGQLVNEKGYLINQMSGAIRSRYTYEDILIGEYGSVHDLGELPMPYRLERHNFNPHKIMGSFDYDPKTNKPYFLRNKFGEFTDKLFRPVNMHGFLINERMDIIDDDGHVRFINEQLMNRETGRLKQLFTYSGKQYDIKSIIGQFQKNDASKEIILQTDPRTGKTVDMQGRPVNAAGYLIDGQGNIIDNAKEGGSIMFNFWEVMFQEPPKIFDFTEFDIKWIKGTLDRDVTKNPRHDDEFDLEGRMINTMGYLVDGAGNVVDQYGKVVFRKEILTNAFGEDAKIPSVFTKGLLSRPPLADSERETPERENKIISSSNTGGLGPEAHKGGANKALNSTGSNANDETNIGRSDGQIDALSKGGLNMSDVFSEIAKIRAQGSQISNEAASHEGGKGNKMAIEDLSSSQVQLNINIDGKEVGVGGARAQPAHRKRAKRSKQTGPPLVLPERPGAKILTTHYANYIEGPTDLPTGDDRKRGASKGRAKKSGTRSNRPIRSAVRNQNRPQLQTHGANMGPNEGTLISPASQANLQQNPRPQVIMQGFMGSEQQRSDYVDRAAQEIFSGSASKRAGKGGGGSKKGRVAALEQSLNSSSSALLSNQLANASHLYSGRQNH